MQKLSLSALLLSSLILLASCASDLYFMQVSPDEPHAILKFEQEEQPGIFPVSIPKVIPLSINGMPINNTRQRWKPRAFETFFIPVGETTVSLSGTDRGGYPALTSGYRVVKFIALPGETYEVTHIKSTKKTDFRVMNSKGMLVAFTAVRNKTYLYSGSEYDKAFALYEAAAQGNTEKVRVLLNDGADPEWSGPREFTALIVAASRRHKETAQTLIEAGANVNATATWTALGFAADRGDEAIVKLLLDSGAQIDLRYPGGYSALMAASEKGHVGVVKLLLKRGANTKIKHSNGKTALDFARSEGNKEIVNLLQTVSGSLQ